MTALHAWLDGEGSLAALTDSDSERHVEFWSRINVETERRRQVTAPVDLQERIMAALPETAPSMVEPWWRTPVSVTPVVAIAAAAGLVALGAAISSRSR
jgi:hypothetical protein